MKVAIAGSSSNVGQYLIEELTAYGHTVVGLTRRAKPDAAIEQRQTDYSVVSLVDSLHDCDALVSTVADYSDPHASSKAHLDMLEACKQSSRCKTFLPSEWTLNVEDYPDKPAFAAEHNAALHPKLHAAKDIKWTILCTGWFMDYVVPQPQRYLRDLGPIWPMDYASKVFTIYGPGTQQIQLVAVRDAAKAVAALLGSKEPWSPYTYLSGSLLPWNELFDVIKKRDAEWTKQPKSKAESMKLLEDNESPESVLLGQFELIGYEGEAAFRKDNVEQQRAKYFLDVHFRTIQEFLDESERRPNEIL